MKILVLFANFSKNNLLERLKNLNYRDLSLLLSRRNERSPYSQICQQAIKRFYP